MAAFSLPLKLNILVAIAAAVAASLVMAQAGTALAARRDRERRRSSGTMPDWAYAALTILGMAAVTAISRGFFLWSKRELRLPDALQRALQVAPLAAIVAVTAPEIFMTHGELIDDLARCAAARGAWRRPRSTPGGPACSGPCSPDWRCTCRCTSGSAGSDTRAASATPPRVAAARASADRRIKTQVEAVNRRIRRCAADVMRLRSIGDACAKSASPSSRQAA